ncbi:DUF2293 domain-containing protein [Nitratireductor sp. ZSWI3]|uniref:DUF2293 domain-containing protein n=1 Tax=Nitratireductor sp. ZSWI3 TaxID=2966359 RepID=UPI00214FA5EA|nr:DUF2293 domain-containing protein [Nitratireductor sp. ZSWI3]MCR4266079.1 DUF2293 domain-containing protein [Nitratireductor sp. ZSWI3]
MKSAPTARRRAVDKALTLLLPWAPFADAEAIRRLADDRKLRTLPPAIAVWLAAVTHIRHEHTGYDALLGEGYERDAARHFVVDDINAVLTRWRATRLLDPEEGDIGGEV